MNGNNKGKGSIFDKIRNLINATESEDTPAEEEKETDGQMVDINNEKNGYKNMDNRPIMEEIFSDTKKKAKGQKTEALEYEQGNNDGEKPPVIHLREIKLEEVKKEQPQQDIQEGKEIPQEQREQKAVRQEPQDEQPEKEQKKTNPAAKQEEKAEEQEEGAQPQAGKTEESPQNAQRPSVQAQAEEQAGVPQKNGAQTKNDGQEKNTQVRQKGAAAEDETAGLRQKGEDETFLPKFLERFLH